MQKTHRQSHKVTPSHKPKRIGKQSRRELTPREKPAFTAEDRKRMKPQMPPENEWLAELQ